MKKSYRQEYVKSDPEYCNNYTPVFQKEVLDVGDHTWYYNDELDYERPSNHDNIIPFLHKLDTGQNGSAEKCYLFQPNCNDNADTDLVSYDEHISQSVVTYDDDDHLGTFYSDDSDFIGSIDTSYEPDGLGIQESLIQDSIDLFYYDCCHIDIDVDKVNVTMIYTNFSCPTQWK